MSKRKYEVKFCRDCANCTREMRTVRVRFGEDREMVVDVCRRDRSGGEVGNRDLVTGEIRAIEMIVTPLRCRGERYSSHSSLCGTEAKFFKPKTEEAK